VLEKDYYEADDLMATVAKRSVGVVDQVWFYTGDKDFMQLLDERTGMLKPGRKGDTVGAFTANDVRREYQLEPTDLIQVFALAGDKADNIPGAPGVGDKTAQKLVHEFGSLEGLYAKLEESKLTPRLKRVLGENKDQVFLSRDLFVIKDDVELELDWDAMSTVLPTGDQVMALLEELGLRRVISQVQKLSGSREPQPAAAGTKAKKPKSAPAKKDAADEAADWTSQREARGYVI
ncbi:MAG: hypothetical protein GY953_01770, partial [bacterium]|nr:hypothetical protein [bacterium]